MPSTATFLSHLLLFPLQEYSRLRDLGIETDGLEAISLNPSGSGEVVSASTSAPAKESVPEASSKVEGSSNERDRRYMTDAEYFAPVPSAGGVPVDPREIRYSFGRPVSADVLKLGPTGRPLTFCEWLDDVEDTVEREQAAVAAGLPVPEVSTNF